MAHRAFFYYYYYLVFIFLRRFFFFGVKITHTKKNQNFFIVFQLLQKKKKKKPEFSHAVALTQLSTYSLYELIGQLNTERCRTAQHFSHRADVVIIHQWIFRHHQHNATKKKTNSWGGKKKINHSIKNRGTQTPRQRSHYTHTHTYGIKTYILKNIKNESSHNEFSWVRVETINKKPLGALLLATI